MTDRTRSSSGSLVVAVLSAAGLVAALQTTLVIPLLPSFPGILGVSDSDTTWLVTITMLTACVATPIVSRCADMFGKRRMLVLSLSMMIAGSLIAALGGTFLAVLIGRALQGFSSSLIPVAMALLRDALPLEKVPNAAAMISATMGIGSALGMPASGVLFDAFGWHSVFIASAIAGALLILAILLVVPASATGTTGRFDVPGALMLSVALTALLLAISKGQAWGWASAATLGCFAIAIVVVTVWVPWELRATAPMVNLRMFTIRPILLTNIASLFLGFAAYASVLSTTQQFQLPEITGFGFGLSASLAGLYMVPSSIAMLIFAPISGRITTRFGGRFTLILGASAMVLAYGFRILFDQTVLLVMIGSFITSIGNAVAYACLPALITAAAPANETAAANGLNSLARTIGMSTMSAVVGAILTGITMQAAGVTLPAHGAFTAIFAIAGTAAALALLAGVLLPRPQRNSPPTVLPAPAVVGDEAAAEVNR